MENIKEALSRDLLAPIKYQDANMEAWEAGRWGQRARLPLYTPK